MELFRYCQGYLLVVLAYFVDKIFKRNFESSPLIKKLAILEADIQGIR